MAVLGLSKDPIGLGDAPARDGFFPLTVQPGKTALTARNDGTETILRNRTEGQ